MATMILNFIGSKRGLVHALEEFTRGDAALTAPTGKHELCVERDAAGRILGGRVGHGDAAAESAGIADRDVSDVRHRLREERQVRADLSHANTSASAAGLA